MDTEASRRIRRRFGELQTERRKGWESHWRELARHFLPRRARFLADGEETNRGDESTTLVNSIGIEARRTLAAGMQSGLTSPARPWFSLSLEDQRLSRVGMVKAWLAAVQEILFGVFARSNFYDQVHLLYDELATFGTGVMLMEEDGTSGIRCRTLTVGEYYLSADAAGRVDTLYRLVRMTPRQIVERFGDGAPEAVRRLDEANREEWLSVLHAIEPARGAAGARKRPWLSTYMMWERGSETLEESGFYEFPALCPRWNTTASDVYGSSPAMDALADCRMLQKISEAGLNALEKQVNPPLVGMGAPGLGTVATTPGHINWVDGVRGGPGLAPMYMVNPNLPGVVAKEQDLENRIRRIFYNDLFLMITQQTKEMTALEVSEKTAEKMLQLGPVLDRLRSELFQPLIVRAFGLLERDGMIPIPPREASGSGMRIEFVSILAQAQKQAGLGGIQQTVQFIGGLAQLNPAVLDKVDFDEAADKVAEMSGVPPGLIRDDETVEGLRRERAEREARDAQMAQAERMAAAAKSGGAAAKDFAAAGGKMAEAAGGPQALTGGLGAIPGAGGA
jgi:hypothetical protein